MSTYAERTAVREPAGWKLARVVTTIAGVIAFFIVASILLIVFDANPGNGLVEFVTDIGSFFAEPFKGIFSLSDREAQVALNWGIGAFVYLLIGGLIARLVAR